MKKIFAIICLITFQVLFCQNPDYANHRIIVAFNENETFNNLDDISTNDLLGFLFLEYNIKSIKLLDKAYNKSSRINERPISIVFNHNIDVNNLINRLNLTGLFKYVEPDYINYGSGKKLNSEKNNNTYLKPNVFNPVTPNDTYFFRQWGLHNDGTFSLSPASIDADVDMTDAWSLTTGNPNITMAILDSGIRMSHPEFAGRFWVNTSEVLDANDSDSNGYIDDLNGWDFVNDDNNPADDHGHGTNVSGIAVATGNNGIGYAGIDWSCKIMPLKVLNSNNSGFNSDIIESFYYAIDKGAKIISISIGGSGFSVPYQDAVNAAYNNNIVIVACMMNFNNNTPYYPAAFTNTIAVGSTDPNDERTEPFFWSSTSGSNYGAHIDVVAPGNYMYGLASGSDTNYNSYWGGTSQATPLVSGICSLILDLSPNLSVDQVRNIINSTAEDQVGDAQDTPGWDQYYGNGRVNAFAALQQTLSINDNDLFNELAVYPNPVNNKLFIKSTSQNIDYIVVTNINGQIIFEKNIDSNESYIDCKSLGSGVYFVELNNTEGFKTIRKFIKL